MEFDLLIQILYIVVGAIISQFFPLLNWCHKKYTNKKKLRKIKNMMYKEYINPLKEALENINTKTDPAFRHELDDAICRLEYLQEHEIKYLSSEIQFEIIRVIEYTTSYLKKLEDIIMHYEYANLKSVPSEQVDKEYNKKITKGKKLTTHYKNTIDEYIKLQRDNLIIKNEKLFD